ncbi:MAG: hypothetical protein ABEJ65_12050 [bacterium]
MLSLIAALLSLVSIVVCGIFYWRFSKVQERSSEQLSNRISGILAEFNSISSDNIELLDDRTDELRRVVDLADLKIKKLNRLIDKAEGARKVLEEQQKPQPGNEEGQLKSSRREKVLTLAEEGHSPGEIADKTGLKPGEVSVIIRLNRSRKVGTHTSS